MIKSPYILHHAPATTPVVNCNTIEHHHNTSTNAASTKNNATKANPSTTTNLLANPVTVPKQTKLTQALKRLVSYNKSDLQELK